MTDRSLFPEGCEIHESHLQNEQDARIRDTTQILNNASSHGIVSGLVVTVNSGDNTKVDVSAGSAYDPSGSFMTLASANTGLSLASSLLGAINYVLLVYDEVQSDPEPHKSSGLMRNTIATNSPRVVILTQAQYTALPESNLATSSNAKDRSAILAVVTATGSALSAANIALPSEFRTVLSASIQTTLIGVTPLSVSSDTATGVGTLAWNFGASTLTYTSPGGSSGAAVPVASSGTYTLTDGTGKTLYVDIGVSLLPVTNVTANVTVTDLYSQIATRFSLIDAHHRGLLGTGIPTSTNPHGLTLEDLSPGAAGSLEEHQDVMHCDGIGAGSSTSLLSVVVNTGAGADTLTVTGFSSGDSVYISGRRVTSIVGSSIIAGAGTASMTLEQIYLSQDGTVGRRTLATFATAALFNRVQLLDVVGTGATTCAIEHTNTGLIRFSDGVGYGPYKYVPAVDSVMRLYGYTHTKYVDVFVAAGTPGTTVTENFTVTPPAANSGLMVFAGVPWSGSTEFYGYGFGAGSSPNGVHDLRKYGTLSTENVLDKSGVADLAGASQVTLTDGLLYDFGAKPGSSIDATAYGDVISAQHKYLGSGTAFSYKGGPAFVGGKFVNVSPKTLTLPTSVGTTLVYVDHNGEVATVTSSWNAVAALGKPYLRVCDIATDGSGYVSATDRRVFSGYKKDQPTGVVGIDNTGRIAIAAPLGFSGTHTVTIYSPLVFNSALHTVGQNANAALTSSNDYGPAASLSGTANATSTLTVTATGAASGAVTATANVGSGTGAYALSVSTNNKLAKGAIATNTGGSLGDGGDALEAISTFGNCIKLTPGGTAVAGVFVDLTPTTAYGMLANTNVGSAPVVKATGSSPGHSDIVVDGDLQSFGDHVVPPTRNFKYSSYTTRHKIISAANFTAGASVDTSLPYIHDVTGSVATMKALSHSITYVALANAHLPIGSTITLIEACFVNNGTSSRVPSIELVKSTYANTTSTLTPTAVASFTPTVFASNTTLWFSSAALAHSVVDDSEYAVVYTSPPTDPGGGATFLFIGVRITYLQNLVNGAIS